MCILTWKILILPANDCAVWWIEMNRCSLLLIICKIHVNKNWESAYTCTLNLRTLVSTYVQVFCWSRSPWNLLFLAKSLITSGLENHKFIIFCWGKGQVQSPRCMFANYYPVIILIHQFKFHQPCLAWSCVADSLLASSQVARGQLGRGWVANNIRNFLTSMNILSPDEISFKCINVQ